MYAVIKLVSVVGSDPEIIGVIPGFYLEVDALEYMNEQNEIIDEKIQKGLYDEDRIPYFELAPILDY